MTINNMSRVHHLTKLALSFICLYHCQAGSSSVSGVFIQHSSSRGPLIFFSGRAGGIAIRGQIYMGAPICVVKIHL